MTPKEKLVSDMREAREADEKQLHTTTWLLKRMRQMKAALQECEDYFEPLASAEWFPDGPSANREGQLLMEVQEALASLRDSDAARSAETKGSGPQQDRQARPEGIAQTLPA